MDEPSRRIGKGLILDNGEGAVTSRFVQSITNEIHHLNANTLATTADQSLDLLPLALNTAHPQSYHLTRSRSISVLRVKNFVNQHLTNPSLNTELIAKATKLSSRYINELFAEENTSLMRYVWQRRLMATHKDLNDLHYASQSISEIALRWGFNDFSHFSRAFKLKYGVTPRSTRQNILYAHEKSARP